MASHYSNGNAFATITIGIVLTIVSVLADNSNTINCDGCLKPPTSKHVDFITKYNDAAYDSRDCFPLNTTLLYVCRNKKIHQFQTSVQPECLSGKCIAANRSMPNQGKWINGIDVKLNSPNCEERKNHCRSPSVPFNIIIEIDGQIITTDMASLYYSMGTKAIYKCENPKPNTTNSLERRCKKNGQNYSWEKSNPNAPDLVCEDIDFSTETSVDANEIGSTETERIPTTLKETVSIAPFETQGNYGELSSSNSLRNNLLIGIFSFLGLVLIAVFFGVLSKNRLGRRYNDAANHARQPPFKTAQEEKNKLKQNFADGEENLQYANIIPIKVNQETIYAEIEIGKIGKLGPTIKRIIDDDIHTIYAEVHHSVVPKDQRR